MNLLVSFGKQCKGQVIEIEYNSETYTLISMSHVVHVKGEGDTDDEEHHGQAVGGAEGLHDDSEDDADDAKKSLAKLMAAWHMFIHQIKYVEPVDTLGPS